jgi:hypothetical protein
MRKPTHSIFRDRALKHYVQRREKDILPRFVSPSFFVFFWILLGLLAFVGLLAWSEQIPTYAAGSGVILAHSSHSKDNEAVALVFLPSDHLLPLRLGLPIQVQVGAMGPHLTATIMKVEPGIISPYTARLRYALDGTESQVITQPSIVVIVGLGSMISARIYAGSFVRVQVQVGSRRILSFFPGLDRLIGG